MYKESYYFIHILAKKCLNMCFSVPAEKYKLNKTISDALDKILILHADHEQNASTSTVRIAGSSGANPFACISAGIASLWGPSHGGANEAVINMLNEIDNIKNKLLFFVSLLLVYYREKTAREAA